MPGAAWWAAHSTRHHFHLETGAICLMSFLYFPLSSRPPSPAPPPLSIFSLTPHLLFGSFYLSPPSIHPSRANVGLLELELLRGEAGESHGPEEAGTARLIARLAVARGQHNHLQRR